MEVVGADGTTGTVSHIYEGLIIGNDAVKYLMSEIKALGATRRNPTPNCLECTDERGTQERSVRS